MSDGDDIAACAEMVRRGDPARFRATMAAPVPLRRMLFPLYAFNVEVARAPWVTKEPLIAEMRLQWWRDALEEIRSGGVVRRHEVVTPLALVLDPEAAEALDALVEARRADIDNAVPTSVENILTYIDNTSGVLIRVAARLAAPTALAGAAAAGRAMGIAAYLSAIPVLVARGKHPLPHGDPAAHGLALAEMGLEALAEARRAGTAPGARPVLLGLTEAAATLRQYRRDPGLVLDGPEPGPSAWLRLEFGLRAMLNRP